MSSRQRLIAACKGEPTDRAPVWLMRQAGRYLPEYLALRAEHSFWEVVKTPELAVEAVLQPLRRFPLDAGIVFSDILVILEAMGAGVEFLKGKGPVLQKPFSGEDDLERLATTDIKTECAYLGQAVAGFYAELHPRDLAVIGFAVAPLTLAAYLIEGQSSRDLRHLKALAYSKPEQMQRLMDGLADAVAELLQMQIDAGADVVQVFDSWAGLLSPSDYEAIALPAARRAIEQVQGQVPVIYYLRGAASHLGQALTVGADTLSIDQSIDMADARMATPQNMALQGNLDCAHLFGPAERIRAEVRDLRRASRRGKRPGGWIANLGTGLVPDTPIAGVAAFVEAVVEDL